jgi:hypothetical protein
MGKYELSRSISLTEFGSSYFHQVPVQPFRSHAEKKMPSPLGVAAIVFISAISLGGLLLVICRFLRPKCLRVWVRKHWDIVGGVFFIAANFGIAVSSSFPLQFHTIECDILLGLTIVIWLVKTIRRKYMSKWYPGQPESPFWALFVMLIAASIDGVGLGFIVWDWLHYPGYSFAWFAITCTVGADALAFSIFSIGYEARSWGKKGRWKGGQKRRYSMGVLG